LTIDVQPSFSALSVMSYEMEFVLVPCRFPPLALCVVPTLPFLLYVFREKEEASEAKISCSLGGVGVARELIGMASIEGEKH